MVSKTLVHKMWLVELWLDRVKGPWNYSFTIVRRVMENSPLFEHDIPFVIAIVKLDEGVRMYSNIVDSAPEKVKVGMKVKVVFEKATEEIRLPKFRPRT